MLNIVGMSLGERWQQELKLEGCVGGGDPVKNPSTMMLRVATILSQVQDWNLGWSKPILHSVLVAWLMAKEFSTLHFIPLKSRNKAV